MMDKRLHQSLYLCIFLFIHQFKWAVYQLEMWSKATEDFFFLEVFHLACLVHILGYFWHQHSAQTEKCKNIRSSVANIALSSHSKTYWEADIVALPQVDTRLKLWPRNAYITLWPAKPIQAIRPLGALMCWSRLRSAHGNSSSTWPTGFQSVSLPADPAAPDLWSPAKTASSEAGQQSERPGPSVVYPPRPFYY